MNFGQLLTQFFSAILSAAEVLRDLLFTPVDLGYMGGKMPLIALLGGAGLVIFLVWSIIKL